ncbi:hypothetical protein SASPL_148320 [Salvia splendens]|uniref:PHD finger protein ALFIN-LIKE n=1 Tax=Salvia splendens TaxID=180675 RepID=A0A8X8Z396_SALSN|nr:hypothetical protein SASPL_148320 [Salvia splendens]
MAARLYPRSVEEVFKDFKGRRVALVKALTTDVEEFYQQCDPGSLDILNSSAARLKEAWEFPNMPILECSFTYSRHERENLCLYGHPHGEWEVNLPVEEVPPELPEPALGINFARDGMQEKDWLALIAVHSDSWLLSVAFYFGARFSIDKADSNWLSSAFSWLYYTFRFPIGLELGHDVRRWKRLFSMINELPTVFEVVTGAAKKLQKEKSPVSNSSSKSKSNSKPVKVSKPQPKNEEEEEEELDEEEDDEHGETLCGACGDNYASDEFWICCDICEKWFHGKCVKITPAKAEQIKQYKCPSCSNKRPRP